MVSPQTNINSFLLSRNERDTSHIWYMGHSIFAGNLILRSLISSVSCQPIIPAAGSRVVHSDPSMRFFVTPIGNSRVCDSEDDIIMTSAGNTTETVTMEISELQMQPFGMVNGTFGEGK